MTSRVPAATKVAIVRATEDSWRELRAVRLAALAQAPTAFGSTLAREQGFDEERWRAWSRSAGLFLALADGAPIGIAAGIAGQAREERAVIAVWVDPAWRGHRIGSRLITSVVGWAADDGGERVRLWVTQGNDSARRLYERTGFELSGSSKALPSNPDLHEDEMVLELGHRQFTG